LAGYAADMAPTTHPIRQPVDDVAAAAASFDGITYPKGASVLKQLFALVGEAACVAGLRSYFARYAWGNTTLTDLVRELEQATGPNGIAARPHRLDIGVYDQDLVRRRLVPLEIADGTTDVPDVAEAALL